MNPTRRVLFVHAHFDDLEFGAAGTFVLWKKRLGENLKVGLLICTDGKSGHHSRSRESTGRMRLREQEEAARIAGFEVELLRLPDGTTPRDGAMELNAPLLAGLWHAIREFEPDYLFAPSLPVDPLVGVHHDHLTVADAVRRVAYLINVPHAFTPEYPTDEAVSVPHNTPYILTIHDSYIGSGQPYDFAVDVEEAFPIICEMSWCHQSQIREWLPWVGRHDLPPPDTLADWSGSVRKWFRKRNKGLGIDSGRAFDFFSVTAWGEVPDMARLRTDFPKINEELSHLSALETRLQTWRNASH